jgi:hypothetical protein
MKLQTFAAPNDLTIIGDAEVRKDNLARYYIDGARVALARYYIDGARVAIVRQMGVFTALLCADGSTHYVMTSDWGETEHLPGQGESA